MLGIKTVCNRGPSGEVGQCRPSRRIYIEDRISCTGRKIQNFVGREISKDLEARGNVGRRKAEILQ